MEIENGAMDLGNDTNVGLTQSNIRITLDNQKKKSSFKF